MTPKERTVMQQALEVLRLAKNSHGIMLMSDPPKDAWRFHDVDLKLVAAITALREALSNPEERGTSRYEGWVEVAEQAEQEPVAWIDNETWCFTYSQYEYEDLDDDMKDDLVPLYAAPVRTKDLTEYELDELRFKNLNYLDYARAVIAADREKNK